MMYTISKEFHFSASHVLEGMPVGHPCGRLHGHNYVVTVFAGSPMLDDKGMVFDYAEFDELKRFIDNTLDHRHLNDVMTTNPTAENLARDLWTVCHGKWPGIVFAVTVSETPKTTASYARVTNNE
jgi:6-pyruvoyltetrahydropterin/6-carboxytetrahydropterin synthase